MAFYEDPATVALSPVCGHPLCVRMGRDNVAARDPDVAVTVPAMVPAGPDISFMRRRSRVLDNDRGRSNADNNLRERWRRSKSTSKYSEERVFLHG